MDLSGCGDPNIATDNVLRYNNVPFACDMNVALYTSINCLLVFIKVCLTCTQTYFFYIRPNKNKDAYTHRMLPLNLVFMWATAICLILFFVLTAANVATAQNGISLLLMGA